MKEITVGKTIYIIEEHFAEKGKTLQEAIEKIILHQAQQAA